MQRVHWLATARTGVLHSRIYEPTSLAGATILIDFHADGYPKRGEPTRSELAVTTACSLAYAVSMLNQQVGFASNGRDAVERIQEEALVLDEVPEEVLATRYAARAKFEQVDNAERLRPVIVDTRRGFDQFQQIRDALARLELTDGMTFHRMVFTVAPRLPKDATILAVLPRVPVETAVALGLLRRQGFAVSALLIGLNDDDYPVAHGRLVAEGVRDVRPITSEDQLGVLGDRTAVAPPTEYQVAVELA